MNDWIACEQCSTIYEYDPVRRIAQCPYCKKLEDARAAPRETSGTSETEAPTTGGTRATEARGPAGTREAAAREARGTRETKPAQC
jgi:hypothetical protein